MASQNKPRLSDITKKNATDRASKLAGSFLPQPPVHVVEAPAPVEPVAETVVELPPKAEIDAALEKEVAVGQPQPSALTASKPEPAKSKERTRRTGVSMDLLETLTQPVPEGLRCTKMIMLCDEHHELLRELAFRFKMPMTALLYNLLEPAKQANEREKQKGVQNHV